MERNIIAFGVILLIVGLAVSPSIYANTTVTSKENDLIEVEIELCGLGNKHTVLLTKDQATQINRLFDELNFQFSNCNSKHEAKMIILNAIEELNEHSVFGKINQKRMKKLTNKILNPYKKSIFDNINLLDELDMGIYCLVAGKISTESFYQHKFVSPLNFHLYNKVLFFQDLYDILGKEIFINLSSSFLHLAKNTEDLTFLKRFSIVNHVTFGYSQGWINTVGITGIKSWNGTFYGNALDAFAYLADKFDIGIGIMGLYNEARGINLARYEMITGEKLGIIKFTGFKIYNEEENLCHFIGKAYLVDVECF